MKRVLQTVNRLEAKLQDAKFVLRVAMTRNETIKAMKRITRVEGELRNARERLVA